MPTLLLWGYRFPPEAGRSSEPVSPELRDCLWLDKEGVPTPGPGSLLRDRLWKKAEVEQDGHHRQVCPKNTIWDESEGLHRHKTHREKPEIIPSLP